MAWIFRLPPAVSVPVRAKSQSPKVCCVKQETSMKHDFGRRSFWNAPGIVPPGFGCGAGMFALLCAVAQCFADAPPLPAYLALPAQVQMKPNSVQEDYGEAEFNIVGQPDHPIPRGKHWNAFLTLSGAPSGIDPEAIWALLKPPMVRAGWTVLSDSTGQEKVARYRKDGHDSWFGLWIFSADDLRLDLVEVSPPSLKMSLAKPAAKPEVVDVTTGDFPYLSPLPGSTGGSGSHDDSPMMLDVDVDKNTHEKEVVGSGSIVKSYTLPPPLRSTILFVTVYREALTQAGWTIVHQVQGISGGDAVLNAHYNSNGRDIWVSLHDGGGDYTIQVADAGADDIAKELDRDCHVALYGIHFDFNKATLRPDSDPVLEKVLALVKGRPDLKLEIEGHTDNVGGEDYNQKLSESRANAVVGWLRAKSVAPDRLTAHGYGMKMPIADNGSDEGRARNRRVELKKLGCGK
jgi:outer membrane protein OmpA-like peptidoglycan-associated protein